MPKSVRIYTTPSCPYCKRAKQFLESNGIEYENIDVSSNPGGAEEMVKKSGQMGVPVLDIGGTIIVGFDKDKIKKALEL